MTHTVIREGDLVTSIGSGPGGPNPVYTRLGQHPRGRCNSLGEPTGELRDCPNCGGRVRLKLIACALHGICTEATKLDGVACCLTCADFSEGAP